MSHDNMRQRSQQNMSNSPIDPVHNVNQEQAPLLGEPGDAMQRDDEHVLKNLVKGTGVIAVLGSVTLLVLVWGSVFSNKLILFSAHPLLNSVAVLLFTAGILVVQPTHTKGQKRTGALVHAGFNDVAFLAGVAGLVIIEYNKFKNNGSHFKSTHAVLGLVTYILIVVQASVGAGMYFAPAVFGGETKAKSLYKYHRISGYLGLFLILATVCSATKTTYVEKVLKIELWHVVVCSAAILIGILPRIRLAKLGFGN